MNSVGSFIGLLLLGGVLTPQVRVQIEPVPTTPRQTGNYSQMVVVRQCGAALIDWNGIQLVKFTVPVMPKSVVATEVGGEAIVIATVRPDGQVRRVVLSKADTDPIAESALAAVIKWRFEPIRRELDVPIRLMYEAPGHPITGGTKVSVYSCRGPQR